MCDLHSGRPSFRSAPAFCIHPVNEAHPTPPPHPTPPTPSSHVSSATRLSLSLVIHCHVPLHWQSFLSVRIIFTCSDAQSTSAPSAPNNVFFIQTNCPINDRISHVSIRSVRIRRPEQWRADYSLFFLTRVIRTLPDAYVGRSVALLLFFLLSFLLFRQSTSGFLLCPFLRVTGLPPPLPLAVRLGPLAAPAHSPAAKVSPERSSASSFASDSREFSLIRELCVADALVDHQSYRRHARSITFFPPPHRPPPPPLAVKEEEEEKLMNISFASFIYLHINAFCGLSSNQVRLHQFPE